MHKNEAPDQRRRIHGFVWVIIFQMIIMSSCTESVPVTFPDQKHPISGQGANAGRESTSRESMDSPVTIVIVEPQFPVKTRDGTITGKAAPHTKLLAEIYQKQIVDEIKLYPPALLKRIKLHQIVLCEDLAFNQTKCISFTDVEHGSIYLDVQSGQNDESIKWTIHHEVFHQIDYAGDAMLDPDPAWESLNPVGFRYTQDVERLQSLHAEAQRQSGIKGFLNRYATASPTEDKAELYAFMVVKPKEAGDRLASDDILRRKAAKIREMIDGFGPFSAILIGR